MISKKQKVILGLFLVAGLTSCNKDNVILPDDPETPAVTPEAPALPDPVGDLDEVFAGPSYFYQSTTRYTFVGRQVILTPLVEGDVYKWTVDGQPSDFTGRSFSFTPVAPGEYNIGVEIDGTVSGKVKVVCVSHTERENYRPGTATAAMVYEYVPAPGQFINENNASMTPDEAARWATERLADGEIVSLGGFGGYVIVGFGHSISNFSVKGNAFTNKGGASNEPGIVYVMQDVNGNGLPDDEWYELKASETGKEGCVQTYAVTYRRPSAPKSAVEWIDCFGEEGTIDYMASFHSQDYYYPSWIKAEEYTLRGTLVTVESRFEAGQWIISPLESGYADNTGSNNERLYIADAIYSDMTPIDLQYVDFIKIQTGVNGKCGSLGELSTEVCKVEIIN